MADVALEVLRFLMLHQDLLVVEFTIAVVTPHLRGNPLLLLPHDSDSDHSRIGSVEKVGCPAMAEEKEEEEARARIQKPEDSIAAQFVERQIFKVCDGITSTAHVRNSQNQW